jgi:hypothetical protein
MALVDLLEDRFLGVWKLSVMHRPKCWARIKEVAGDSFGVFLWVLALFYPPALRAALKLLRCDTFEDDGELRMLAAPHVKCHDTSYAFISSLAWTLLILFGLGVPVFYIVLVRPYRKKLGAFETKEAIGVVAAEYELKFYFWESLVVIRRFAVLVATALTIGTDRSSERRMVLLLGIGVVASVVQKYAEPFDNRSGTLLDVLEQQSLMVFLGSAAAMLVGFSGTIAKPLATLLVVCAVGAHLVFVLQIALIFIN